MKRHSIKWRFILPFALILAVFIASLSYAFSSTYTKDHYEDTRAELEGQAKLLLTEIQQEGGTDAGSLQTLADRYAANLKVRVTILQPDGSVAAESEVNPENMVNHLNRPEVQQAISQGVGYNVRYSTTLKTRYMYVAVADLSHGTFNGIVRLAKPLEVIDARAKGIRTVIGFAGLAALLAGVLVSYLVAEFTTRPIRQLTLAADAISKGDYSRIPVRSANNEINDLVRAFSRMAEQIQLQLETIGEEKIKLEQIVNQLMDGLLIVSNEGQVQLLNRSLRKMFHVTESNPEGKDFIQVIPQYQLVELVRKTVETGKDQGDFIELKAEGKYLLALTTLLQGQKDGGVLILVQDRTKNRELEEMRQVFVSNVSHELRTPLSSLKALTETLQGAVDQDPQAAKRFLQMMDVEIDKLSQMVLELLELSRIESGRVELNKKSIPISDLILPAIERMRLQSERSGLKLEVEIAENLPLIHVDAERIEQVLVNLIHNAIKFTPAGGSILVSANQAGNEILISVKDTGIGIPEKDLPHIFERFYKVDPARATGGTGLGLAIARHLVEAHQGRIWAESKEGEGARFIIALPV
ncbi:MAG TPA: ATP-binding protein [Anaerolineaceae bacterium]|nr:ATP-binding protein [Anaerolineaceae bacterium]